jgi:hypothetical protein
MKKNINMDEYVVTVGVCFTNRTWSQVERKVSAEDVYNAGQKAILVVYRQVSDVEHCWVIDSVAMPVIKY